MQAGDQVNPSKHDLVHVALSGPSGFLAFGLGSGLSPRAPGTAGTLVGMLLWLPLINLPVWIGVLLIALMFWLGIRLCNSASTVLGVHDHGGIVWDEIVAIWLVLLFIPFHAGWWLAAFIGFRLFDIWKPWPIGWLDRRVSGGFGIMIDDVIAALYTLLILYAGGQLLSMI